MNAKILHKANKLVLGGAQIGLDYGVSNTTGKISCSTIEKILGKARLGGVTEIDTAPSYGDSEAVLGSFDLAGFGVSTKLSKFDHSQPPNVWVSSSVRQSLNDLRIEKLSCVYFHDVADLLGTNGPSLVEELLSLKSEGIVERVGISIYGPEKLDKLMSLGIVDAVQAPFSIVDRRIQESGWLEYFNNNSISFYARSIFLQGLLLMHHSEIPTFFDPWNAMFQKWSMTLGQLDTTALEVCLSFVMNQPEEFKVIVGVQRAEELEAILEIASSPLIDTQKFDFMRCSDVAILNPFNWTIQKKV